MCAFITIALLVSDRIKQPPINLVIFVIILWTNSEEAEMFSLILSGCRSIRARLVEQVLVVCRKSATQNWLFPLAESRDHGLINFGKSMLHLLVPLGFIPSTAVHTERGLFSIGRYFKRHYSFLLCFIANFFNASNRLFFKSVLHLKDLKSSHGNFKTFENWFVRKTFERWDVISQDKITLRYIMFNDEIRRLVNRIIQRLMIIRRVKQSLWRKSEDL